MKRQFKDHLKFGSCWYDNFFKTNTRQRTEIKNKKQQLEKKDSADKKLKK